MAAVSEMRTADILEKRDMGNLTQKLREGARSVMKSVTDVAKFSGIATPLLVTGTLLLCEIVRIGQTGQRVAVLAGLWQW